MEADDANAITYRTLPVENQSSKLYLLQLPEKGGKKQKQWVFSRALVRPAQPHIHIPPPNLSHTSCKAL